MAEETPQLAPPLGPKQTDAIRNRSRNRRDAGVISADDDIDALLVEVRRQRAEIRELKHVGDAMARWLDANVPAAARVTAEWRSIPSTAAPAAEERVRAPKDDYLADTVQLSNKLCRNHYTNSECRGCPPGRCWYDEQKARRVAGELALTPDAWKRALSAEGPSKPRGEPAVDLFEGYRQTNRKPNPKEPSDAD